MNGIVLGSIIKRAITMALILGTIFLSVSSAFAANMWGIRIQEVNGKVSFNPDVFNAQPGQPLGIESGDLVYFVNNTDNAHSIVRDSGELLSKGQGWNTLSLFKEPKGTVINYHCEIHPEEKGSIVVVGP